MGIGPRWGTGIGPVVSLSKWKFQREVGQVTGTYVDNTGVHGFVGHP